MIQVNRIYLIFNRLVTKKFLVDTSELINKSRSCSLVSLQNQFLCDHDAKIQRAENGVVL